MNSASFEELINDFRKTLRNGFEERTKDLIKTLRSEFDSLRNEFAELGRQQDEILSLLRRIIDRLQDGEEWKRSVDDEEWEV